MNCLLGNGKQFYYFMKNQMIDQDYNTNLGAYLSSYPNPLESKWRKTTLFSPKHEKWEAEI